MMQIALMTQQRPLQIALFLKACSTGSLAMPMNSAGRKLLKHVRHNHVDILVLGCMRISACLAWLTQMLQSLLLRLCRHKL